MSRLSKLYEAMETLRNFIFVSPVKYEITTLRLFS